MGTIHAEDRIQPSSIGWEFGQTSRERGMKIPHLGCICSCFNFETLFSNSSHFSGTQAWA